MLTRGSWEKSPSLSDETLKLRLYSPKGRFCVVSDAVLYARSKEEWLLPFLAISPKIMSASDIEPEREYDEALPNEYLAASLLFDSFVLVVVAVVIVVLVVDTFVMTLVFKRSFDAGLSSNMYDGLLMIFVTALDCFVSSEALNEVT